MIRFYIFSIFDIKNQMWLSIDDTINIANILEIPMVPQIYLGTFDNIKEIQLFMDQNAKKPSQLGHIEVCWFSQFRNFKIRLRNFASMKHTQKK